MSEAQEDLPSEAPQRSRHRISIEERAASRERSSAGGRDRFSSLVRSLQAGREMPVTPERRSRMAWNPAAGLVLRIALIAVAAYVIALFVASYVRTTTVETWTGPDTTVQSGRELAGCAALRTAGDETFPAWIRYGGTVYGYTSSQRPLTDRPPGATDYVMAPYQLGGLRIFEDNTNAAGLSREYLLVRLDAGVVAAVYDRLEGCI